VGKGENLGKHSSAFNIFLANLQQSTMYSQFTHWKYLNSMKLDMAVRMFPVNSSCVFVGIKAVLALGMNKQLNQQL
jgi:hypothetical protein